MKYLIFFSSFFIFFIGTLFEPLRNWDEAWYAEIIKNMASGDYSLLVPFWNGQYYFDKPPLYFWLSFPVVKLFGLGEWQIRLVSVISSACSVLLVYLISSRLFSKVSGFISVLVFLSLGQIYVRFSHGNLDALLITLFLATYYFWLKCERNARWALLSGITLGLGFLVKGWTLGLFPLFVIGIHSLLCERKIIPRNLLYIIVGAILSSGWWYILGTIYFGMEFFNWYVLTLAEGNFKGISFSLQPLIFLLRDLGVWFFVILFYLFHCINTLKWGRTFIFLFTTILISVLVFGMTHETPDWHNLPIYPFVAIIVGWFIYNLYEKFGNKTLYVVCCMLFVQIFIVYKIESIYPDRSRIGADLGYMMTVVKNPEEKVVLDDRDFTSFLYYSNIEKVYVVSQEGGEPGEFWTLKYSDLPEFIKSQKSVVLISKNPKEIYSETDKGLWIAGGLGYDFTRFSH